jgi:hypothetical protein
VLQTKGTIKQALVLRQFIQVAAECLQLNNFNTFMGVLSGLNINPVQRLKRVWGVRNFTDC